jgi:acetyl-CoA carboxylase biotin carboxylase subunit
VEFAKSLHQLGIELISTGGTAQLLSAQGLPVLEVAELTGFPEMLDGRVKTLHPMVHAGLLARREVPSHMQALQDHGISTIDILVVNLYPFEATVANPECSLEDAIEIANKIKYPIMMKATAGGGGKGMRICKNDDDVREAWDKTRREALAAFGNDGMYMEKFVEEPRHIEIQIAGDQYGKACHLSERDCSIQRRHQKLVEETPSPFMTDELREKMGQAAIKAAEAVQYEGVGTVEFLVDKNRDFYFMEMNTRIQVEHTITEEVINYDLVKEQIKLAAGDPISGRNYYPKMHAIQCRINAEDPYKNFAPSPGKITSYHSPGGHGVRLDTHAYAGYVIPPHYDSMISKLIVVAQTREEAITKMERALDEYIIEGIKTTIPFHQKLMKNAKFREGDFTTKFMDTFEM